MKKLFSFLTGGIQRKIIFVFILALIVVVVTFMVVTSSQISRIREITNDENRSQLTSIKEISSATTTDLIDSSLGYSTKIEASLADNVFKYLKRQVEQFATGFRYLQLTMEYPEGIEDIDVSPLFPNHESLNTVDHQLIPSPGLDLSDIDVIMTVYLMAESIGTNQTLAIRNGFINSAFIVAPDGYCVIADMTPENKFDSEGNLVEVDLTQRDWFKNAVEHNGVCFSDAHVDIFAKKLSIVCSRAVKDVSGNLIAVVGMDVFLDTLSADIEIESNNNKFIFMLNKEGKVVFSPSGTDLFVENPTLISYDLREFNYPELSRFVNEAMAGSEDVYSVSIDDKSYFMTGSILETPQWLLVSAIDKMSVESPVIEMEKNFGFISEDAASRVSAGLDYSKRTLMTLILIDVLLCLTIVLVVTSKVVKPLGMISRKISRMKAEDFSFEMRHEYETGDEVEVLAKAFSDLSVRTKDYINQITTITAEKERMTAELDVAAKIQADMLPRQFPAYPERGEFDLFASMSPAREVGGDFYDFFMVDEDRIALVMADVSGKGIPAALFMVIAKSLIKNRTMLGGSPSEILFDVNNQLCESNEQEYFVTVWLAIINLKSGKGFAANAGHEHPAIRHKDGSFELVVYPHSPAVAVMENTKFEQHEFQLERGDTLFIYTDGVTEATNNEEKLFGTNRMVDSLNSCPNTDPRAIIEAVNKGISGFVAEAEQFDDITMLCFRYDGDVEMLELEAKNDNLDEVLAFVDGYLEARDCPMKIQTQIDIAVEEIFVNISNYAYNPNIGKAIISAAFDEKSRVVSFSFTDSGIPFNPLERKDPDVTQKLEDRKIGGLGIYMVKKSMDNVRYEYRDGQNILTIEKQI